MSMDSAHSSPSGSERGRNADTEVRASLSDGTVTSEVLPPAPPFGSKRAAALALYCPPFKFHCGYIHDGKARMVADQDGFGEGSKVHDHIAARVRGWGRIGYLPDPEALQDEVGAVIADALTAYWEKHAASIPKE